MVADAARSATKIVLIRFPFDLLREIGERFGYRSAPNVVVIGPQPLSEKHQQLVIQRGFAPRRLWHRYFHSPAPRPLTRALVKAPAMRMPPRTFDRVLQKYQGAGGAGVEIGSTPKRFLLSIADATISLSMTRAPLANP